MFDVALLLFFLYYQSNEVGGSYHMEKEGLKRSLALKLEKYCDRPSPTNTEIPQGDEHHALLRCMAHGKRYYFLMGMGVGLRKALSTF